MVRREGGLVPAEILLDRLPLYMLYADGRLVFRGPQPPSFPGPLLPALVQVNIGPSGLGEVMTAVEAAGLPELYNSDAISQVADGPNTEVTFFDDNGEHFFSVYSLRIADQKDPQVLELAALIDFIDKLAATSPETGHFRSSDSRSCSAPSPQTRTIRSRSSSRGRW